MAIYEYQAKKLYVKKEDLEQSLGLKLTDIKTRIFETKKELPDYLKPYSLMPTFTLSESVALLLDINPNDYYQQNVEHYLYSSTEALLTREIDSGALNNYGGVSKENIKISHIELEKWAKNKGYKWNLPSYYSNNINQEQTNQTDQIAELQAQLKEKDKRIAELEAEKQNLKKPEPPTENYNPTERGTHLQAIAILAIREAERKPTSLMTNTGKIKNSSIADILAKEAKTLFTNPRDKDAFRRRLAEALKTYSPQAE